MKITWNQKALDILRAEANVFFIDGDMIIFTYDEHEYAPHQYIYNNNALLSVVRDIVTDRYETCVEADCLDLFPAEYLPYLN